MKLCSRCRQEKPLSEFSKRGDRDALKSHCRSCKAEYDEGYRSQNTRKKVRVREQVIAMHGAVCFYCGTADRLEIDHLLADWRGGSDDVMNLVPACRSCNASKGSRTPGEWFALRKGCAIHRVAPGGEIVSQCYRGGGRRSNPLLGRVKQLDEKGAIAVGS